MFLLITRLMSTNSANNWKRNKVVVPTSSVSSRRPTPRLPHGSPNCESGEGGVRSEELDELKRKLNAKLQDTESQLESALGKAASAEKANQRLRGELEDLTIEVERVSIYIK